MPTQHGSALYKDSQPGVDAGCVALCRAAGALIYGKTVRMPRLVGSDQITVDDHCSTTLSSHLHVNHRRRVTSTINDGRPAALRPAQQLESVIGSVILHWERKLGVFRTENSQRLIVDD